ncbi:hypothetical protein F5X99DRAFT_76383 [Biscogniauxia marginata]|nr:hypothetical protein F5X99DRAFT_76383 [Biscogniauxia marginata]
MSLPLRDLCGLQATRATNAVDFSQKKRNPHKPRSCLLWISDSWQASSVIKGPTCCPNSSIPFPLPSPTTSTSTSTSTSESTFLLYGQPRQQHGLPSDPTKLIQNEGRLHLLWRLGLHMRHWLLLRQISDTLHYQPHIHEKHACVEGSLGDVREVRVGFHGFDILGDRGRMVIIVELGIQRVYPSQRSLPTYQYNFPTWYYCCCIWPCHRT